MTVTLLVLAASVSFAWRVTASAARWPNSTVTYRDHTHWRHSVKQAVRWWSQTPGRVRIVPARAGRAADIEVRAGSLPGTTAGRAYYPPHGDIELDRNAMRSSSRLYRASIAAHEFGHALGLRHTQAQCTVMEGTVGLPATCDRALVDRVVRCGPQRADARALVALYGGRLGEFRGFRCPNPDYVPPARCEEFVPPSTGRPDASDGTAQFEVAVDRPDHLTVVSVNGTARARFHNGIGGRVALGQLSAVDRVGRGSRSRRAT